MNDKLIEDGIVDDMYEELIEELDEDLIDMYGPVSGDDITQTLTPFMNIQPSGKFHEINVNGKKILVPDAMTISIMEATIKTLRDKVIRLEQNLQTANFNIRKLEGYVNRTNKELTNKVSSDDLPGWTTR